MVFGGAEASNEERLCSKEEKGMLQNGDGDSKLVLLTFRFAVYCSGGLTQPLKRMDRHCGPYLTLKT